MAVVVVLRAAPDAAAIFPEHPHVEGHLAVILEVEGAPPAQTMCAGERLPAASQGYAARSGSLDRNPRGPAAAAVRLQPEPAWT